MRLRDLHTGQYVTVCLSVDQGRIVFESPALGTVAPEQVLDRHRITYATDAEWGQLAELGYPIFLKTEELENLGPMGSFARHILVSCPGTRIRLADWSWEDPILEVWWRGSRFRASFHELGPILEYESQAGPRSVNCSWSSNLADCFQKFSDWIAAGE